ncbi:MAG: homoserine dehydrogenase [Nitrospirae bacterium]|jgi:homoserine dehydrogenase|nr:homoserine dehydrogenase [Nitrospirota bacterium]
MTSPSQEKSVVLGLIGYGTVGQGFVRLLRKETDLLGRRLGFPLFLKTVADRNIKEKSSGLLDGVVLSHDPVSVINDPEIQIVIELIGGIEPAKSLLLEAIRKKKSVVTANKALLALHGEELFHAVQAHRTDFAFEGSVGGGIPILRSLREGIGGNRIQSLRGIINGTCNYILTRMTYERQDFETVLREAQSLGYAEADPTFDIDGIDAAHKLAILGTLSFGSPIPFGEIPVEGIRKVQTVDIEFGRELGYVLKLLGIAKDNGTSLDLRVHPAFLPEDSVLAEVDGVFNAVEVNGESLGPALFYGRGAGSDPTATAVMGDVMELARAIHTGCFHQVPPLGFSWNDRIRLPVTGLSGIRSEYYLRFMAPDSPGTLSYLSGVLGEHDISIESVIQKGRKKGGSVPVVILTHTAPESSVRAALNTIDRSVHVTEPTVLIRVEGNAEA